MQVVMANRPSARIKTSHGSRARPQMKVLQALLCRVENISLITQHLVTNRLVLDYRLSCKFSMAMLALFQLLPANVDLASIRVRRLRIMTSIKEL